jgi:serpin B
MFSDLADFGRISAQPMAVDSVVHEAVLTVDEVGLEGAAATAVVMRMLSMHRDLSQPIEVKVDRPFLFLVRHRPSGAIYFLARVVQP